MKYPSPSLIISLTALVVALGGVGVAANGGNFILGQGNSATATTRLLGPVAGDAVEIRNLSTAAGATALRLQTAPGQPPMEVTSTIRVAKLNADTVDGKHAAAFASATSEGWHYIGDAGEPAFVGGWQNADPAPNHNDADFQHAAYRIDQNGVVHLAGMIAGQSNGAAFKLEGQYCPWFSHEYSVVSTGELALIVVLALDDLGECAIIAEAPTAAGTSLNGIAYQTYTLEQQIAPPPPPAGGLAGRPVAKRGAALPRR